MSAPAFLLLSPYDLFTLPRLLLRTLKTVLGRPAAVLRYSTLLIAEH